MLRFVAGKLEQSQAADPRAATLAGILREAAGHAEAATPMIVAADRMELTARAFAGFAAVLQKQLLPEAVAHGNRAGEAQIRQGVESAMAAVSLLLSRAALGTGETARLDISPLP